MSRTLALAALVLALAFVVAARAVQGQEEPDPEVAEEPEELAHLMAYMERYAEKLHLAGTPENWPLAAFYAHEVEETLDEVVAGGYVEEGVELAAFAEATFLPALARVEGAVESESAVAFRAAYAGLIDACNACHAATGHGFVQVVVPDGSGPYPGQRFAP